MSPHDQESLRGRVEAGIIDGATTLRDAFRDAEPFRHIVIDRFLDADFCARLMQEFPAFDEKLAVNEDGIVGGKAVREQIADIGPAYRELDALARSEAFRDLVSTITDIPALQHDPWYFGGGTHENREGQGLDAHIDFNYHPITKQHRRLNLIVYLNEEWQDDWGGSLQLHRDPYLPPSQDDITVVTPLANRCVIFETNEYSWHGFPRIVLPEGRKSLSRRSFALYYYTAERPADETAPEHSTVYVEQHLPEWYYPGMTLDGDQLQHIRNLVASRDQHLKRLYGYISHLNGDIANLRREVHQHPVPDRDPELDEALRNLPEIEARVTELKHALDAANKRIHDLEHSSSWRITAPLRAIKTRLTGKG